MRNESEHLDQHGTTKVSREDAGGALAEQLMNQSLEHPLVLLISRMALPMATAIQDRLGADLDLAPAPESLNKVPTEFAPVTADKVAEDAGHVVTGRDVVLVDDVVITGTLILTAVHEMRRRGAKRILVATAVLSAQGAARLRDEDVEVLALKRLHGTLEEAKDIGGYLLDSAPVSDQDVHAVRERAKAQAVAPESDARGAALIFHESTRDGKSEIMSELSRQLRAAGFVTTLGELPPNHSGKNHEVGQIVRHEAEHSAQSHSTSGLPIVLIGSGRAGSAVLEAAASVPELIRAVVVIDACLLAAESFIQHVQAPVLFVSTGEINEDQRAGLDRLMGEKAHVTHAIADEIALMVSAWVDRFFSPLRPVRGVVAADAITLSAAASGLAE